LSDSISRRRWAAVMEKASREATTSDPGLP
jgi:hypothetical protein